MKKLIEEIISTKGTDPLSSTLRLFVADHFYREYPNVGYVDPHSRFVFVVSKKDIRKRRRPRPAGEVSGAEASPYGRGSADAVKQPRFHVQTDVSS